MKLRNKKTGEIVDLIEGFIKDSYNGSMIQIKPVAINNKEGYLYGSLAELNEEWEDYEEPKEYWFINELGNVEKAPSDWLCDERASRESIGNHFSSEEEAEKAVEKLKAWKRLRDKGFRFTDYDYTTYNGKGCGQVFFNGVSDNINEIKADLDLLFGGGE